MLNDDTRFVMETACVWEATARKVGNVHPGADFADVGYPQFLVSACAAGRWFESRLDGTPVGRRVGGAVARSFDAAGTNTNLGIVLLLAPLANVPGWWLTSHEWQFDLREGVRTVLAGLTVRDAFWVYDAIRRMNPGGLGDAPEQDVRNEPTVTLLETMRLAADRDQIARQYATDYADVFDLGVPAFLDGMQRFSYVEAAIIHCQHAWLAAFPDSLIARKCGTTVAVDVQQRAAAVVAAGGLATAKGRAAGVALDKYLRSDGNRLNPGTTADLVTACLFVALREGRVKPNAPFRWNVSDWL